MTQIELLNTIRAEIERRMDKHWDLLPNADSPEDDWTHNELCELGAFKELEYLETFLDTLEEPENPIYELNQFLINWVRDGQTDAEKDARWEAYRRFFELHDEAMMQEPNAADKKAVKEIVKTVHKEVTRQVKEMVKEQPVEGLEEAAEAHTFFAANQPGHEWETHDVTDAFKAGAEWQKAKMMEDAVEGEVSNVGYPTTIQLRTFDSNFMCGEKVRFIIVKEDEK